MKLPVKPLALSLVLMIAAGPLLAQTLHETAPVGDRQVTFFPQKFLTEQENAALRMVLASKDALDVFLPQEKDKARVKGPYAALAVAPDDGFIRDGALVPSASAITGMADLTEAETTALSLCKEARKGTKPCVIVLRIEPLPAG